MLVYICLLVLMIDRDLRRLWFVGPAGCNSDIARAISSLFSLILLSIRTGLHRREWAGHRPVASPGASPCRDGGFFLTLFGEHVFDGWVKLPEHIGWR